MRLIYFIILISVFSCKSSNYNLKQDGKSIIVKKGRLPIDTIGVFSDVYSKSLLIDSTLYYVDNLRSPDRINLKMFKVDIVGDKLQGTESISIKSLDLNYDRLIHLKFKSRSLILKYESNSNRLEEVYELDSMFSE